ncbi:dosage compensation regulator-like isoform X2 [Macrosteles quadrilineatus]|uniref:dosage compensation regulator-like isoform X2 n=1 Tax=Macrosteles quadrilineatus TaxID=74068 RepID=UPI0023E335F9|nr:dosage compensation regulator-like isoform X2 [Macrosteles quadrilineatus]
MKTTVVSLLVCVCVQHVISSPTPQFGSRDTLPVSSEISKDLPGGGKFHLRSESIPIRVPGGKIISKEYVSITGAGLQDTAYYRENEGKWNKRPGKNPGPPDDFGVGGFPGDDDKLFGSSGRRPGSNGKGPGNNGGLPGKNGGLAGNNGGLPGNNGGLAGNYGGLPGNNGGLAGNNGGLPGNNGGLAGNYGGLPGNNGGLPGNNGGLAGNYGGLPSGLSNGSEPPPSGVGMEYNSYVLTSPRPRERWGYGK